jgi:hypothetical protein
MEDFPEGARFTPLHRIVARGDLAADCVQDRLEAGTAEHPAMRVRGDGGRGGGIKRRHFQLAFRVGARRKVKLGLEPGKVRKDSL